jgi:hypothetical protein
MGGMLYSYSVYLVTSVQQSLATACLTRLQCVKRDGLHAVCNLVFKPKTKQPIFISCISHTCSRRAVSGCNFSTCTGLGRSLPHGLLSAHTARTSCRACMYATRAASSSKCSFSPLLTPHNLMPTVGGSAGQCLSVGCQDVVIIFPRSAY